MTLLNALRVWTYAGSSQAGRADNIIRYSAGGPFAVDFSERLNENTVLASAVASSPGLTISAPVVSGDKRHIEFSITSGVSAGTDYTIAVTATYEDGTTDSLDCVLRA